MTTQNDLLVYLDDCYSFNRDPAIKMAIDEINRLNQYREVVEFIANDYIELSYEKAQWQRDDWRKRCVKLQQEQAAALVSKQGDANETI